VTNIYYKLSILTHIMWMVQYVIIIIYFMVSTFAHQTCYLKLSFLWWRSFL